MLQESDLSRSSQPQQDARSRLEQAKHRYENLLMQVGPTMIAEDLSSSGYPANINTLSVNNENITNLHNQSSLEYSTSSIQWDSHRSPERLINGFDFQGFNDSSLSPFRAFRQSTSSDPGPGSERKRQELDKNETIILLQEENDRLRNQLDSLTITTEQLLREAEESSHELLSTYDRDVTALQRKNNLLQESNIQLEESLKISQQELTNERAQLQKMMKLLDRFQRRSRNFVEVQRKSHQLLRNMDGMLYTAHWQNDHLHHLQDTQLLSQQQQMESPTELEEH